MAENLTIERTTEAAGGFLPQLSGEQWIFVVFIGLIILAGIGLLIWLIWDKIKQNQHQDFYKDAYQNAISLCKNNCPPSMLEADFKLSPDETHEGVVKGKILGYNLLKYHKNYYDVIVYNPSPFSIFNPSSWFSQDRIALMNSEKEKTETGKEIRDKFNRPIYKWHSPLVGSVTWYTIGTNRVGFLEYAVNDINLSPKQAVAELKETVGITAAGGLLKEFGVLVGDALHSNPSVRGEQKLKDEIIVKK